MQQNDMHPLRIQRSLGARTTSGKTHSVIGVSANTQGGAEDWTDDFDLGAPLSTKPPSPAPHSPLAAALRRIAKEGESEARERRRRTSGASSTRKQGAGAADVSSTPHQAGGSRGDPKPTKDARGGGAAGRAGEDTSVFHPTTKSGSGGGNGSAYPGPATSTSHSSRRHRKEGGGGSGGGGSTSSHGHHYHTSRDGTRSGSDHHGSSSRYSGGEANKHLSSTTSSRQPTNRGDQHHSQHGSRRSSSSSMPTTTAARDGTELHRRQQHHHQQPQSQQQQQQQHGHSRRNSRPTSLRISAQHSGSSRRADEGPIEEGGSTREAEKVHTRRRSRDEGYRSGTGGGGGGSSSTTGRKNSTSESGGWGFRGGVGSSRPGRRGERMTPRKREQMEEINDSPTDSEVLPAPQPRALRTNNLFSSSDRVSTAHTGLSPPVLLLMLALKGSTKSMPNPLFQFHLQPTRNTGTAYTANHFFHLFHRWKRCPWQCLTVHVRT